MYQVRRYRISNLSPLLLSLSTGDQNMVATMDYINGSSVLGIFAGEYIKYLKDKQSDKADKPHDDPNFYKWFLTSGLVFSNAYLREKDNEDNEYGFIPTPLSIQKRKNEEDEAIDLLFNEVAKDESRQPVEKYCNFEYGELFKALPRKSLNFHNARPDRIKGHSTEIIFNYESLDAGQEFEGVITGEKEELEEFIKIFNGKIDVNIGRSKTAQYGRAIIEIMSVEKPDTQDDLEYELIEGEFVLTLLSDAIIYNKNGLSTASNEDLIIYIADYLDIKHSNIKIIKSFKKPVDIENFVSVWKLKKPAETALKAGSCFKIEIDNIDEKANKLIELQGKGIGERCGEGFGRFELNFQENEDNIDVKDFYDEVEKKYKKPADSYFTDIAKDIFEKTILDRCKKAIEMQALFDSKAFRENIPSSSLLGRLEMMLKNQENKKKEDFVAKCKMLRKTAADSLEKCRNESTTLYQCIMDKKPDIQNIVWEIKDMEKICKAPIGREFIDNKEYEFYKMYWLTFFRMMRKTNKKENG